MTTIKIRSHHQSLASAVAASGMDLSYNPAAAKSKIRETDLNVTRALVTPDGVYFIFNYGGMNLLHKFEPFFSAMTSDPFKIAFIVKDEILISDTTMSKDKVGRAWFAKNAGNGALAA